MSFQAKFCLVAAIFLWASAFVGIRAALESFSPEGLALLRYLFASLFMTIIYARLPKKKKIKKRDALGLFLVGAIGIGIYNITLNYGEISISSGMASFIISQSPLVTALFAMIFLGERLTALRAIGFLISVIGVGLIAVGERSGFSWDSSIYYMLLATLAGGIYSAMQKPFLKNYNVVEATTLVIWGGTVFLLLFFHSLQKDLAHASLKSILTVAYLGVFPAALGYIAWTRVLSEIPASRAVSFLYFMPFLATLLGWLWLNEVPTVLSLVGGICAIMGVGLVNQSYRREELLNS